jgi:hypothetical protein
MNFPLLWYSLIARVEVGIADHIREKIDKVETQLYMQMSLTQPKEQ